MKLQLCKYRALDVSETRDGLAIMKTSFDLYDVECIIDLQTRAVLENIWTYTLIQSPMAYIDTEYWKS